MQKNIIFIISLLLGMQSLAAREITFTDSATTTIERQLNEVEIAEKKSARSLSVFKALNINSIPAATTFSTAAVLQQIPSLSSDIEGNLRLRGSNKVTLLFEGVPITLFEENRSDLLIQMPVALFSSVLLFNMLPTASINEGEAGAVDFIFSPDFTDKSVLKATVAKGSNDRYNASVLAGSRIGKFRWQAGYDFRQEYRYRTYDKTTVDKTGTAKMNNTATAKPRTHIAMFNAQYLLTPSDFINFNALFQTMDYSRLGNINNTKTNTSGVVVANVLRQRNNTEKQTGNSEGLNWKHIWKEQKASFEASVNYDNFNYDQGNNFTNKNPKTGATLAQDRLFINQDKHQWFGSAKLTKMWENGLSSQLGYIGQWHKDNYSASDDDLISSAWVHNLAKSNDYELSKNLQTGFAELTYQSKQWKCLLGVQLQFDNRNGGKSVDANQTKEANSYLLPHIEINWQQSPFLSWTLRYQERVNRPLISDLNPFTDNSDATYIHQGNPSLENELAHVAELSNTCRVRNLTLNPVFFYRYRNHQIIDIATQQNGTTVWTKENASSAQDVGLEMNLTWKPFNFLTADASATGYHYEIDGTRQGYGIKGKYSVDAKGSVKVKLPLELEWEVYGYYTDRQLTVQGEIAALGSVGSALSYSCLKKHLDVALTIDNIFNSIEEKTTFNTMGTQQTIYRNRDARTLWLNVSYKI
ncbi:outer membrane beta-barrel family protein [Paludibacter jiangxiensis]|uniref:Outer membrane receptor proteins n=1 Tax=Paludibacter jiangxiensis TaxID=681398 RepID=A0A161LCU3_9BACT|nr:outer membrane beta-barrel family protein [Paludibacter jiangxiensis]GAT61765.1 outer membrane receptor proteins [Paludibacter jiangxiensis]